MDVSMFSAITDAAVGGIPLVLVVLGLVAWLKQLGVAGRDLTISAMIVGAVFGAPFMYAQIADQFVGAAPGEFVMAILTIVVYALVYGLVASGVYKVGERFAQMAGGLNAAG